jgi:acyl-CoA synthetase (AMP-forming)/AMP-acid ligase II
MVGLFPPCCTRLLAIATDAEATFALTTTSVLANSQHWLVEYPELAQLHWLASDDIDADLAESWQKPIVNRDTLALIQYTSGSTGTPKGVMVSHSNLLANCTDLDRGWNHTADSTIVTWLPTFHDMGLIYGVIEPLYKGCSCYMMPPVSFLHKPIRWLQAISTYKASHSGAPNFAYDLCVRKITAEQKATLDLSSWQMALNGAEPVRADVLQRFAETFTPCGFDLAAFCPGYGLAEATLKVAAVRQQDPPIFLQVDADALAENRVVEARC